MKTRTIKTKKVLLPLIMTVVVMLRAESIVQPTGTGTFQAGDATILEGAAFPEGSLEVPEGTVTIRGSWQDVTLDEDLKVGLGFWVDANCNCILNDDGGVEQWADVRETFENGTPSSDHEFIYNRAMVYHPVEGSDDIGGSAPVFKTDARHPGRRFLSFGDYGSGRWMYLADASGEIVNQPTLSFYCVVGFESVNNAGFLLCDITNLSAKGQARAYFHKSSGSLPEGPIGRDQFDNLLAYGEHRLDGERIDTTMRYWKWYEYQTFGHVGPAVQSISTQTPYFNTLCNHGNYTLENSQSGYRHGGAVFGEILVWDRVITENERRRVEAYLRAKWFARPSLGRVTLAQDASIVSDVAATNLSVTSISGAGTLVKRGSGVMKQELSSGALSAKTRLEAGSVVFSGAVVPPQIVPVSGVAVTVGDRSLSKDSTFSSGAKSGLIGQNETSAVFLDPVDADGVRISATNLVVKLVARAEDASYDPVLCASQRYPGNLLANHSFETPIQADNGYAGNPADFSWLCDSDSGIGVATKGSAWYEGDDDIPDGRQFAYIAARDNWARTLSQEFTAPVTGLYRITFAMTRRTSRSEVSGTLIAKLSVDGVEFLSVPVYRDKRGEIDTFKIYGALLPPLTAGTHVLSITPVVNQETDRALALDDFRLTLVEDGSFVYVPNGGFQSGDAFNEKSNNGFYKASPTDTGWTGEGTGGWGITQNSSWHIWTAEPTSEDAEELRQLFLQKQIAVSRSVTFSEDGRYVLSMKYANRANAFSYPDQVGTPRATGHAIVVYLDGVEIGRAYPANQDYRTARLAFEMTAGEHVLKIANVMPTGRESEDLASIVDDIRIKAVPVLAEAGKDAFMEPYGAWTFDAAFTETNVTDGARVINVPGSASVEKTFSVPSNGFYYAALTCAGAAFATHTPRGVYNNYLYYPAIVRVSVDGEVVGTIVSESDTFTRSVFRLPYLTAGSVHTIEVCGIAEDAGMESKTRISAVEIEPLAIPSSSGDVEVLQLEVLSDAKLDLQYIGSRNVRYLRLGGERVFGTVDAQSHPQYVTGPGSLKVVREGTIILVR